MGNAKKSTCGDNSCCECCESCDCGCACCSCGGGSSERGFRRRHQTRAEQVAKLEEYLKDLKNEVQAVEEKLADLKRTK